MSYTKRLPTLLRKELTLPYCYTGIIEPAFAMGYVQMLREMNRCSTHSIGSYHGATSWWMYAPETARYLSKCPYDGRYVFLYATMYGDERLVKSLSPSQYPRGQALINAIQCYPHGHYHVIKLLLENLYTYENHVTILRQILQSCDERLYHALPCPEAGRQREILQSISGCIDNESMAKLTQIWGIEDQDPDLFYSSVL